MTPWLRGKRGGAVAFLAIASLLVGGLGWASHSVLRGHVPNKVSLFCI